MALLNNLPWTLLFIEAECGDILYLFHTGRNKKKNILEIQAFCFSQESYVCIWMSLLQNIISYGNHSTSSLFLLFFLFLCFETGGRNMLVVVFRCSWISSMKSLLVVEPPLGLSVSSVSQSFGSKSLGTLVCMVILNAFFLLLLFCLSTTMYC